MFSLKNKLDKNLQDYLNSSYYTSFRVLIKCKKFHKDIESKIPSLKGSIIRTIDSLGIICANVNQKSLLRLIEYPEIEYICFDEYAFLCGMSIATANGVSSSKQISLTGKGISIALIDSGVFPHTDLLEPSNKILKFTDLINDFKYPYDDNGHGTAISGSLCGSGTSSKFVYKGIAEKSNLCCYKAFDSTGKGFVSDILYSIDLILSEAKDLNIRVLCLPFELLGHNFYIYKFFDEIFSIAISKNIIPVVPAGSNTNKLDSIRGFALSPNCITVGGFDIRRNVGSPFKYSSGGSLKINKPDFSATCSDIMCLNCNPLYVSERNGVKLYPSKLKDPYISYSGTSLSCAYISGVCALVLEYNPNLSFKDIYSLLKLCSVPLDFDKPLVGQGKVDITSLLKNIPTL